MQADKFLEPTCLRCGGRMVQGNGYYKCPNCEEVLKGGMYNEKKSL